MFVNVFQPMDMYSSQWVNQAIYENNRVNAQTPKQYPGFTYFETIRYQAPAIQFGSPSWCFPMFNGYNSTSGSSLWGGLLNNNFNSSTQYTGNFLNLGFTFTNSQPSTNWWGGLLGCSWNNTTSGFPAFNNKKATTGTPKTTVTSTGTTTPKPTATVSKPVTKPETPKVTNRTFNTAELNTSAKNDFRKDFISTARKYMGYNEADGSSRKISKSGEWCADFIKYVLDETYASKGLRTPSGLHKEWDMPHLRVENIKNWGIQKNMYLDVAHQSNKAKTITDNVKAGDILILRENKASHTGFVTKIYPDGSFDTIEGNRDDKVSTGHYSANHRDISGFVQVT